MSIWGMDGTGHKVGVQLGDWPPGQLAKARLPLRKSLGHHKPYHYVSMSYRTIFSTNMYQLTTNLIG